jgi:hypothetical protein
MVDSSKQVAACRAATDFCVHALLVSCGNQYIIPRLFRGKGVHEEAEWPFAMFAPQLGSAVQMVLLRAYNMRSISMDTTGTSSAKYL